MSKTLAVVGAGAKAAAIAARATVLRAIGTKGVPNVVVIEQDHAGSAWSGRGRYSSGFLTLCTPGEKDVGFPYDEVTAFGSAHRAVSPELFARFSWSSYLVSTGALANWVDRGREHPRHSVWADYLAWVFEQAALRPTNGRVTKLRWVAGHWKVHYEDGAGEDILKADGVVLTGNGEAVRLPSDPDVPSDRVFDADTFWAARETFRRMEGGTVAVVGGGGAAGAILSWLASTLSETEVVVHCINSMGTLFPRGDGFRERQWFSDPSEWQELSLKQRRNLLGRTETGVISARNKAAIDASHIISYIRGKATAVTFDGDELSIRLEDNGTVAADYLISATGFDAWSLLKLVDHPKAAAISPGDNRDGIEADMLPDLSFRDISGLPPHLHVPSLAGLAQGPGMGNLGSLGLMAKAVLEPYILRG